MFIAATKLEGVDMNWEKVFFGTGLDGCFFEKKVFTTCENKFKKFDARYFIMFDLLYVADCCFSIPLGGLKNRIADREKILQPAFDVYDQM